MVRFVRCVCARGGFAEYEAGPAEFLDVGECAERGGGGDVVAAIGGDEVVVVGRGEAREVDVVDRDGCEVPVRVAVGDVFEVEQDRRPCVWDRDVALPGVAVDDSVAGAEPGLKVPAA